LRPATRRASGPQRIAIQSLNSQPHLMVLRSLQMAKSQKHGNKEAKKPKAVKIAAPIAGEGLLSKANMSAPGKKRG